MRILRLVATGTALLIVGGCAGDRTILEPAPLAVQDESSPLSASAARRIHTSGAFDAIVDFSTLTLTPRGRNCLLQVAGQLVFTGTIQGAGTGQTTALVSAPCADVAANPPGTFSDVFKSELSIRRNGRRPSGAGELCSIWVEWSRAVTSMRVSCSPTAWRGS